MAAHCILIFSNKVDLSQRISLVIPRNSLARNKQYKDSKGLSEKYCNRIIEICIRKYLDKDIMG